MDQPDPYNIEKTAVVNIPGNIDLYDCPVNNERKESTASKKSRVPKARGDFKCRDLPFLILFIIFWIGLVIITINTFRVSPYDSLFYGRNSAGELCGSGNYTDYKYIAYFMSTEQVKNAENPIKYKVCANYCPEDYLLYEGDLYKIDPNTNETLSYIPYMDIRNTTYEKNHLLDVRKNFENKTIYEVYDKISTLYKYDNYLIPSVNVFNRCIPDLSVFGIDIGRNTWSDMLQGGINFSSRIFQSVLNSLDIILMEAGIALGLTAAWLLFTYYFTGLFVWITVILSIIAIGCATLFSWYIYMKAGADEIPVILDTKNPYVNKYLYNEKFFLVLSIILSIVFFIIILFFLFARKRINLAIKIIKESGKAIKKYPLLSLIPLIQYIMIIIIIIYFVLIYIPVTITSTDEISANTQQYISKYVPLKEEDLSVKWYSIIIQLYVVLGFYWTYYFVKAIGKTTIGGVVATWYWAPTNDYGKKVYQRNAILKTFARVCWYNLGSLALGSLILGIISLIKYILAKIQKMAKKNGNNAFVKCLIGCLRCFIECLDRIVKYITKNAYIEIAIYGYSFCKASYKATKLILRNAFRVVIIDRISSIVFILGKLLVTAATVFFTFLLLKNKNINDTYMLSIPLIISFLLGLMIISIFMSVLSTTIDTIFVSVCEDLERNDGSKEKPYYMSKSIRKVVVKNGSRLEQDEVAAKV
ncbi:DUF580-domain-containing protein [Piromyces finnis]|uniref:Protein PNS1 n=1 Tax=Piromyces finnis TaxID=1754191 RepID=A0A1Y1V3M2_9FUNG|nr:DUF580-domain-containing protein [Piromyces finnis]|eukprot:ORX45760.1 DUF580-domain-containing protein [Piromyces finnis]